MFVLLCIHTPYVVPPHCPAFMLQKLINFKGYTVSQTGEREKAKMKERYTPGITEKYKAETPWLAGGVYSITHRFV